MIFKYSDKQTFKMNSFINIEIGDTKLMVNFNNVTSIKLGSVKNGSLFVIKEFQIVIYYTNKETDSIIFTSKKDAEESYEKLKNILCTNSILSK